ncbi:MAG: hypothetical protein GXO86_02625 [Chlorobi bacterium]|nr:hypothetical protein [Chlorobiota bacterium]
MTKPASISINEIIGKLSDALDKEYLKGYFGIPDSTEKIELFETAFGVKLPVSFKTFLRHFDGGFIPDGKAAGLIASGEFEEAEWNSFRFLSIDKIINDYERLYLDDWKLADGFKGFYPYIPFGMTADGEKLVFVDNSLQETESKVFLALHDSPASGWFVVADNFTELLINFYNTGGDPGLLDCDTKATAENALKLLGSREEEKEDPREIIKRTTAYLELFPDNPVKYTIRGDAYGELKQYKNAQADFNKSLDLDPKMALAYYCRGSLLLSLNRARQALIDLDSAHQLEPGDAYYLNGRAEAFFALKKMKKALADCNRAIEIDNRYFSAYYLRRKIYTTLGETEKAEADARVIEELLGEDE